MTEENNITGLMTMRLTLAGFSIIDKVQSLSLAPCLCLVSGVCGYIGGGRIQPVAFLPPYISTCHTMDQYEVAYSYHTCPNHTLVLSQVI